MKAILLPVGSHGDVHPFVGLGMRLQQRGHDVTVATGEPFRELVEKVGLTFHAIGTQEEFDRIASSPEITHPRRAAPYIAREVILPGMSRQFEYLQQQVTDDTMLIGSALGFGSRLMHETTGTPFVSLHLQPVMFYSVYETPLVARGVLTQPWVPRWVKQAQWNVGIWLAWDRHLKKQVNAYRRQLGLSPVASTWEMSHSPQQIIGLFPSWFAPPQPDWPSHTRLTSFPLWDERGVTQVSPAVEAFLSAGEPPLVFTPGSSNQHGQTFFATAIQTCRQLNRRGMLLTRHGDQIPRDLPPEVRHFDYAPFSEVLPRCAALVHIGGIGTLSQALAAGIPQLLVPMSNDQPDNARRIKRLGVGDYLYPNSFKPTQAEKKLRLLLSDPAIAQACAGAARRLKQNNGLDDACDIIEQVFADSSR